ncbi:unnamed protein product [Linum tenue]|uniref:RNA helicase n=1 Tax=Linum tenue TaxID=586396 RepID=A0AAV0LVL4_9ROSI|nr:unnamed protein product [Linum tenue]
MATAESSSALGPVYAPDDPTLPKPWMGVIDRSTNVMYYWNPETNVTQYEKPSSLPPPLPPGMPPTGSTPKLAQIPVPHSAQLNGMAGHGAQQAVQPSQQQGQQVGQLHHQAHSTQPVMQQPQGQQINAYSQHPQATQQQGQLVAQQQVSSYHGAQSGQVAQQQGQGSTQMMQHPSQQMLSHMGQQMPQPSGQQLSQQSGQPMPQHAAQQMPQQIGQHMLQHQSSQMQQSQGQFGYQKMQYMPYQQSMPQPAQQYANQHTSSLPRTEEADHQQASQTGYPTTQYLPTGGSSAQNLPVGNNPLSMPPGGAQFNRGQQFAGPSGPDLAYPPPTQRQQNHMGPPGTHNQQPNMPHAGLKMGYENNAPGRAGNDYYMNAKMEGTMMSPHQPNGAGMPMARNQQDARMAVAPFQSAGPAYSSGFSPPEHTMHNLYKHGNSGAQFPSGGMMMPPFSGPADITNSSPADAYRQKHEVTAMGDNVPAPFMTFDDTGFPPEILRDIHSAGFMCPTPIQAQTWPIALQSRDIVAIAKTGSGKTLGYLIPAFVLLRQRHNNPQNGPTVLVLAPTRELATQIQEEVNKFGRSSRVSCTCLYGGAPKGPQLNELDRGADIVVATPGRLNDILEMKKIDFRQVSLLVLDEADRMLDMGFEPQVRKIVSEMPPRRQTLMYTATWPKEVRKIAGDLLVNPVQVNIGNVDELAANKSITQIVEIVPHMEKDRRLDQILRAQERGSKVIIFCSTKRLCDQLARGIGRHFGANAIHGDKSQGERDWVLNQFRSGMSPVLVATDVAARGLDIKDIRVVINYDFPTGIEDYVHRIGRTGRAGATGVSYTFFSEQDWKHAPDLIKVLEGANQQVPPEVRDIASRGGPGFSKDRGGMNRFDPAPTGGAGGRWDAGGRGGIGMRDGGGYGGRGGGMRDFGPRGGPPMRDGGFSGRGGGMRDEGFGGRSGGGRDGGPFGGQRNDMFPGRGNRGRGGGFGGSPSGWGGRNDRFNNMDNRGPPDRFNSMDNRGRGGRGGSGRGGRFDGRREMSNNRSTRGRSPSRSRSRSRSWSRSRSRSRSRDRSRSYSRSRSPRRSRSYSRSPRRSRSFSRSPDQSGERYVRRERQRESLFDVKEVPAAEGVVAASESILPVASPGLDAKLALPEAEQQQQLPPAEAALPASENAGNVVPVDDGGGAADGLEPAADD